MNKQQREQGAAAIQVFLHEGEIIVLPLDHSRLTNNGDLVEALLQRKAYKGDWSKIWKVLTAEGEN
jgi:hypothetical protein